ncbi:Nif3-like dinuclear metal center hexameric protein [Ectothiorhodospiraceae bacterium 2226]|nr:Nif3-like dinuclear metal center hexameric protein [Ectothiorhodospiraceae bacterium 2226]
MVELRTLTDYLARLLAVERFQDYAPNGLQVEGRGEVQRVVSGVTASLALIEAAVEAQADAVLVHHGYFWRGEDPRVVGMKRRRLQRLLANDMSLLAYHLPLDAHPQLGNNAQLASRLGLVNAQPLDGRDGTALVWRGELEAPIEGQLVAERIAQALGRVPLHVAGRAGPVQRVALCTGGAQGYIEEAVAAGVDAYITGEVSEQTVHVAREEGIDFFAAGHHATERYGVQALGRHLAEHFGIEHRFIDVENPA